MQSPIEEVAAAPSGQSLRVLVWEEDLIDMWSLDPAGARVPFRGQGSRWHVHPELELTAITRGEGVLYAGDHIGRFRAPDCILLAGRLPHVWKADGALEGVAVQFGGGAAGGLLDLPELAAASRLWRRAGHALRWRGRTRDALCAGLAGLAGAGALERLARFLGLVETMRAAAPAQAQSLSARALVETGDVRAGAAMRRVLDHLIECFREEITLDELVRMSGRSQATFCRHFAALTGRTVTAYLNAIRIQEVCRQLAETRLSITAIAFAAGFNNLSHFHALFRRACACTPLAFRRRHALG